MQTACDGESPWVGARLVKLVTTAAAGPRSPEGHVRRNDTCSRGMRRERRSLSAYLPVAAAGSSLGVQSNQAATRLNEVV